MSTEHKYKGIVLSVFDYNDKDKVMNLFTLESGIITVIVKSVKLHKSKFKHVAQVFSFGEFVVIESKGFDIVKSADIEESFYNLSKDLIKYYAATLMIEIVKKTLMPEQANHLVFINLLKALNLIYNTKANEALVVSKFINGILKISGYKLNYSRCSICNQDFLGKFYLNNQKENNIVCRNCKDVDSTYLEKDQIAILRYLDKTKTEDLGNQHGFREVDINNIFKALTKRLENNFEVKLKSVKLFKGELI